MGLAVPSLVEASRGLPSVKPPVGPADDDLVTSVAIAAPVDEPVSPELALVDPVLAARLRALLPDIDPQIGLEPDPPALRLLPSPEPDNDVPLGPPPELVDELPSIAPRPVGPVTPPPLFPSRADRWRALAKSFAAGAAVATFVTVGVVAKLGEGPAEPSTDPETVPPRTLPVAPGGATGKSATRPAPKSPTTSGARAAGAAAAGGASATKPKATTKSGVQRRAEKRAAAAEAAQKKAAAAKKTAAVKQAAAPEQTSASKPESTPRKTQTPKIAAAPERPASGKYPTAAPAVPAPRRFAWAPVDGAVAYRIELFRGTKQVLEERTKDPAYELVSPWRHAGRSERLTSGSYRWYVWPVFSTGAAANAVVQAKLVVP